MALRVRRFKHHAFIVATAIITWSLFGSLTGSAGLLKAAAASDPVIAAAGDIACDPASSNFNGGLGTSSNCRQKYTSDLLVNMNPAAVLDLGDNQYYCGGYQAFLQSYDLSWGRVKSITRPSVGNHEYLTAGGTGCDTTNEGAAGYFNYFGSAAGNAGQGWYSYNVGTWHIIALNSNCSDAGGCSSGSPQYTWLQSDLATHSNYCTLAYWHIPLYSSGGRAAQNSKSFWNLLYSYNADVILNGHDHIYERFAPQDPNGAVDSARGIREFIAGTGGSDHTSISVVAANSEVRNASTFGVLKLTLHASSYDWQFVPEAGKTFTDSGTANCHGTNPPTATPTRTSTSSAPSPTPSLTPTNTPAALPTATPTSSTGSSATFVPQADAYVDSANPTRNYGTGTTLRADGSPDVHSYLRFSVSGLGGKPITRARLSIYMNSSSSAGLTARAVSDTTWGETSITYNTAPALGTTLSTSGAVTSGTRVTLDVSPYVTREGTYSFGVTTSGSTAVSMGSRESANPPQLILDLGTAAASPTPTQTNTPTSSPTATVPPPTNTPTATGTPTATATLPPPTPTNTPTATAQPTSTNTATFTPTLPPATATNTPTPTATLLPTSTPTATALAPTSTSTPTSSPSPFPTPTDPGTGSTLTLVPQADTYVNSGNPTTNYGTGTTLRVDGSPDVRSYVRFSVSGLNGAQITRARLQIYMNSSSTSYLQAWRVADNSWVETAVNYNTAPPLGSLIGNSGTLATGTWVTIDVTSYVTGQGTFSIGITTPGSTALSMGSRESANAPKLLLDLSASATSTPTATQTSTATPTLSATPTATGTNTPTATLPPTNSPTPTATDTSTPTNTSTPSPTGTDTPTSIPTNTSTPTATATLPEPTTTPTATSTATGTYTPTATATLPAPTNTPTFTATATATLPLPTNTPTATATQLPPTDTPTFTATVTATLPLPTSTDTPTATPTEQPPTSTPTATQSPTSTAPPTDTPPATQLPPTNTATPTATVPPTDTPTFTPTNTPTAAPTNTPIATPTGTFTPTPTPTDTAPTDTPTATPTATLMATPTTTDTPTALPTVTPTPTAADTPTPTATLTATPTATDSPTALPTDTPTSTPTPTPTPEPTATPTAAPTPTLTSTPTATLPPPTDTPTATPTVEPTGTPTLAPTTDTPTPTPTDAATPTDTPTPSAAPAITLTPAADAYVDRLSPTTNHGMQNELLIDGSQDGRGYVRFDVSGLNGTPISRATLRLYANTASTSGIKVVKVADNSWDETAITYLNAPALGSTVGTSRTQTAGTWVTLDITSYVTDEGTYSLAITTPGRTTISLAARESGSHAPQLVIELGP